MYEEEFKKFSRISKTVSVGGCFYTFAIVVIVVVAVVIIAALLYFIFNPFIGHFFDDGGELMTISALCAAIALIIIVLRFNPQSRKKRFKKGHEFLSKHPDAVKMYSMVDEKGLTMGTRMYWLDKRYNGMHEVFADEKGAGIVLLPGRPYNIGLTWGDLFNKYIIYCKDVVFASGNTYFAGFDDVTKVFSIEEESASGRRKLSLSGKVRRFENTDSGG